MIIDRFDTNGNSIANRLYHLVDNEVIGLQAKVIADGSKRLDQYAYEYYGESLNWWIIASASGLGWWLNLKKEESDGSGVKIGVVLCIHRIEDVIKIKQGAL